MAACELERKRKVGLGKELGLVPVRSAKNIQSTTSTNFTVCHFHRTHITAASRDHHKSDSSTPFLAIRRQFGESQQQIKCSDDNINPLFQIASGELPYRSLRSFDQKQWQPRRRKTPRESH